MSSSLPRIFSICLVFAVAIISPILATDHIVGANKGWNPGMNYTLWANNHTFYVGDLISFRYQKTQYNVFEVNQTGYDNCTTEGAVGNWSSGKDFIPLNKAKRYYFICGNGQCFNGMKVSVVVHPLPSPPSVAMASNHSSTHSSAPVIPRLGFGSLLVSYALIWMFTKEELDKATHNYHTDGILHRDWNYALCKGNHEDREILVKKFGRSSPKCEDDPVDLIASVGNGNFSEYIYLEGQAVLPWEIKLRIATQVANALAYLHEGTSRFQISVPIPLGKINVDVKMGGTTGYLAPEVISGRITAKSDGYNVGKELLNSMDVNAFGSPEKSVSSTGDCNFNELNELKNTYWSEYEMQYKEACLKANILEDGNRGQAMQCADLAVWRVKVNPEERPTMKEVAKALRSLKSTQ
ncbi:hypothetical protein FNV43_RR07073 [Rhamnella rubrinervis]|uniref:Phytocyanin domain-containing protein n=1 Tax=Rhamnella rubrinervis TaxID=2594499 RepID=A0A8K0HF08_9ROSA|nr:hypothetical protein FNV43_RR07073 [Rhamnella rubrinervis]